MSLLLYICTGVFLLYAILEMTWKIWKRKLSFLPSAPNVPWLGSIPYFGSNSHELYKTCMAWTTKYNHLYVSWFAFEPAILIGHVEYIQPLLKSQEHITKSFGYDHILKPWLGDGLLISSGAKWKRRRVALTAAFHFAVLCDFMEIFEKHALNLVSALKTCTLKEKEVEVQWMVSLATLDTICETSMGFEMNALHLCDSSYVKAVCEIKRLTIQRVTNPFVFFSDTLYKLTSCGKQYYKCLDIVHSFTMNVINKNIASRKSRSTLEESSIINGDNKRKVFIDVLIDLYENGEIDVEGIREEVDTFMFEGHDTVSSALCWTFYEIGRHPEIQEKLHKEISSVSANDEYSLTEKIKSLKFMEYVIKESLRLHPPVSGYERTLEKEMVVNGNTIPTGTTMVIDTFSVHMNPAYWSEPTLFNPLRFEDVEVLKRSPYCFVPFSAGPRNCIGQKFAMLEMKVFIYHILLNFNINSIQAPDEIKVGIDLITYSLNGINIEFSSRDG